MALHVAAAVPAQRGEALAESREDHVRWSGRQWRRSTMLRALQMIDEMKRNARMRYSRTSSRRSATDATDTPGYAGTASRLIRSAAHHASSRLRTPSRLPTGADLTVAPGPRRGASRRRFPCLPTHVPLWQRPGRCDTGFSHLDCRSVLILIVALHVLFSMGG